MLGDFFRGSQHQTQEGEQNQQAGRDINNNSTTIYQENDNISFDLVETENLITDLYEISVKIGHQEGFTYDRMTKIEDKNKLNEMEQYFEERIKADIVFFKEIQQVLYLNQEDFRDRFEYIIGTIKGAILAIDNSEKLTPQKVNLILGKFYKQTWDWKKKQRAERLVHFMYFYCFLGKKETGK